MTAQRCTFQDTKLYPQWSIIIKLSWEINNTQIIKNSIIFHEPLRNPSQPIQTYPTKPFWTYISITISTYPNHSKCFWPIRSNLFELFPTYPNLSKSIQTYPNLKELRNYLNLSNLTKSTRTYPNKFKSTWTYLTSSSNLILQS